MSKNYCDTISSDSDESSSDSSNEEVVNGAKALPWPDEALELKGAITSNLSISKSKPKPSQQVSVTEYASDSMRQLQTNFDAQKLTDRFDANGSIQAGTIFKETLFCSKDFQTENCKEINILLLGESGVGKSTFINSFANYMKHDKFEDVINTDLSVLIPARFYIFDKHFKKQLIQIGSNDTNEHLADGEAATQDVKTYVFFVTIEDINYQIRLIDTPGMGDRRGIDQDNKNCDYVLNYLSRVEKIHAICILLKPTNTRLDVFLNYCVTQVLSRLEKSAIDNMAFLFTNTRGQNYTPGDTYISLEMLVKSIKTTNNVELPLSQSNVFCFDNEAFRFLAATKHGVEFKEGILEANVESWRYSYHEVYRMLSYVVKLQPHDPKKTIGINHARKMVLQLSQPLAEIVQLIGDNIYQLDQHTKQLLMENQTIDDLKQNLYMPVVDIRVKELPEPVTVCTAPQCSAIYKVAGKNKYHYKQRCHNPCYLNNVPAEIVGDPNILHCWAIERSTQTCHQCKCRFNTHMHIYYETDTFENKIVDENIMNNITTKEDATREQQIIINKVLNHKQELETEHTFIVKCTAAFAHFLQNNAITPINDSLKVYVKYLIAREENLGPASNSTTLDYLRRLLAEYEQEKNALQEALKYDKATNATMYSSPQAIETKVRELFVLPHFGAKIKKLYDLHQSGGVTEHRQSELVVQERYKLSIINNLKSKVNSTLRYLGLTSNPSEMSKSRCIEMDLRKHFNVPSHIPICLPRELQFQQEENAFCPPYIPREVLRRSEVDWIETKSLVRRSKQQATSAERYGYDGGSRDLGHGKKKDPKSIEERSEQMENKPNIADMSIQHKKKKNKKKNKKLNK